jgi:hypothetical protein
MKILEKVPRVQELELKVGKEYVPVQLSQAINTHVEPELEDDPKEQVMSATLDSLAQPNLEELVVDFIEEEDPQPPIQLDQSEKPKPSPIELKPLPPGLKYAFLHGNRETPIIISDKLSKVETQQLLTILEKHQAVLGYSLQDLKGTSPNLCTHRIPIHPDSTPSRELQCRLNSAMREVVKK